MAVVALVLMVVGLWAAAVTAATFTVDPTQIFLSARTGSALLTLRNESDDPLRFQLSAFAWSQDASGEMHLETTDDVVFFPTLLTLKPGETRKVRVGSAVAVDVVEKTYRVFVEELPPADTTAGVRVLTKMGIPVFVRPKKEVAIATLNGLRLQDGLLRFGLTNAGTVHVVPQQVKVTALAGASPVFDREVDSWYVLAGGRRDFTVTLPETICARVTSIIVNVHFASSRLQEPLQTPGGACPH